MLLHLHTLKVDVPTGAVTRFAFFEYVASQANLKKASLEYVCSSDREKRAESTFAKTLEGRRSELYGMRNVDVRLPPLRGVIPGCKTLAS